MGYSHVFETRFKRIKGFSPYAIQQKPIGQTDQRKGFPDTSSYSSAVD